jgi:hypothetical protein
VLERPGAALVVVAATSCGSELLRLGVRGAVPPSSEESELGLVCRVAIVKESFLSSHLK